MPWDGGIGVGGGEDQCKDGSEVEGGVVVFIVGLCCGEKTKRERVFSK